LKRRRRYPPILLANCLFATSLYELGARGGKVKYDNGSDAGGVLLDITDAADALGPFKVLADPLTSLFLATLDLAVNEGDNVHQDMVKHRNLISRLQCWFMGNSFIDKYIQDNPNATNRDTANQAINSSFSMFACYNLRRLE
jgi:hypothetical protein